MTACVILCKASEVKWVVYAVTCRMLISVTTVMELSIILAPAHSLSATIFLIISQLHFSCIYVGGFTDREKPPLFRICADGTGVDSLDFFLLMKNEKI